MATCQRKKMGEFDPLRCCREEGHEGVCNWVVASEPFYFTFGSNHMTSKGESLGMSYVVIEAGMIERDRYRDALESIIANETAYNRGDALSAYIVKTALGTHV